MQRSRAVFITGIIYALIGLVLAGGGIWLASLGGSIVYIILGLGILATAALLLAQRRSAPPRCPVRPTRLRAPPMAAPPTPAPSPPTPRATRTPPMPAP